MFKQYFEDLELDKVEEFGSYEITREEIIEFASKYDPQPFHLDEEMAKKSVFGKLCASGWMTGSVTMSMMVKYMSDKGFAGMGSPGLDNLRWKRPVCPGDVLRVRGKLVEKRDSESRPNIGLVKSAYDVLNQNDEVVMSFVSNVMVLKRGATPG